MKPKARDLHNNPTTKNAVLYTRVSTDERLGQDFNSLDHQREAGELYVKSQAHTGWTLLSDRYDDGGFTGANIDRPALKRLLSEIEAKRVQIVVVYKIDRLSRSLLDFAKLLDFFDQHGVSFVSVTQQFDTSTPMGRLMLHVLLSFAQFEREIISERTRDKIAATRRKGKWSGGMPLLGYDVSAEGSKLIVNRDEATRVQAIFNLYLEHRSLLAVVQELDRRGWLNKRWTTRKGQQRGGKPFTKPSLHRLLTNVAYVGKVKHKTEVYPGEHDAIIDHDVWQRVQTLLGRNGRTGGSEVRNKFGALLKGILRCSACNCAMSPSHTKKGNKRYRYYLCNHAQNSGWDTCPSKSIPTAEIERFVIDQIRRIGRDPALLRETLAQVNAQQSGQLAALESEQQILTRELAQWHAQVRQLVGQLVPDDTESSVTGRLAELQERIRLAERRSAEIHQQSAQLSRGQIDEHDVARALAAFDPVWDSLTLKEQTRIVQLIVERVDYDGASGRVLITFAQSGLQSLAQENQHGEAA